MSTWGDRTFLSISNEDYARLTSDWGEISTINIEDSSWFWALIDEMMITESKFMYNRTCLLDAFVKGDLYGLQVGETESMFNRHARLDSIFLPQTFYGLPAFCIANLDTRYLKIIWVDPRYQRHGLGTKMVTDLNIKKTSNQLENSTPFWRSVNLEHEETNKDDCAI